MLVLVFGLAMIWFVSNQLNTLFTPDEDGEPSAETKELLHAVEKVSRIEDVLNAGLAALLFSGLLGFWVIKGITWQWPDMDAGIMTMIRLGVFGISIVLVVPVYQAVHNKKWFGNLIGVLILAGIIGFAVDGIMKGWVANGN